MKLILRTIPALCLLFCGSALYADEASRLAKASEYLRLAKIDQALQQSMKQIDTQIRSGFLQQTIGLRTSPTDEAEANAMLDRLNKVMHEALSWEKLEPQFAKLYASEFTDEELDGIVAFYKTPAGQALAGKSIGLMPKASAISQNALAAVAPEIQKIMKETMDAAAKKKTGQQ